MKNDGTLYISPIISYRSWFLFIEDFHIKIKSLMASYIWKPKYYQPHLVVYNSILAHSGIYSWKTIDLSRKYQIGNIFGDLYNWGDVIECENGYLSQYAYPKSFLYWKCGICHKYYNEKSTSLVDFSINNQTVWMICNSCYRFDIESYNKLWSFENINILKELKNIY